MTDFYLEKPVSRTRKDSRCFECDRTIPSGSSAVRMNGKFEGEFWSGIAHEDCLKAAAHYQSEIGLGRYDAWSGLNGELCDSGERDDFRAILKDFPDVLDRLGLTDKQVEERT